MEFRYQGSTAAKSTLLKFNQGVCTDVLKYHPCLNFFGYFLFSRKESDRTYKDRQLTIQKIRNENFSKIFEVDLFNSTTRKN